MSPWGGSTYLGWLRVISGPLLPDTAGFQQPSQERAALWDKQLHGAASGEHCPTAAVSHTLDTSPDLGMLQLSFLPWSRAALSTVT